MYVLMASIIKKLINGHSYYYIRECQRVNGKPKIIWQKYLGRADDLAKRLDAMEQVTAEAFSFGLPAALYAQAERLGLIALIDSHCPKRAQGLSVGQYLVLAAINRVCQPTSKQHIAEWHQRTVLRRLLPASTAALSSQRFWDHMDRVDTKQIQDIEKELAQYLHQQLKVDPHCLLYDTTNFFTYIDTDTPGELAQRGHNKQKRNDLRQLGLALLVSRDGSLPLFHELYPGQRHDSREFTALLTSLLERLAFLGLTAEDVTLVFDKGNNSPENIQRCAAYHYVGALVVTHYPDLMALPLSAYTDVAPDVKAYLTTRTVYGQEHRLCLTWSKAFAISQERGVRLQLNKRLARLAQEKERLEEWIRGEHQSGCPPTVASVQKKVSQILRGQHMAKLITFDLQETAEGLVQLEYTVNEAAFDKLKATLFGKNLLFTNRMTWGAETTIGTYHAQYHVEDAFRQLKNPQHVSFYPVYHWTDQKLRVHAFYCVLALLLAGLLLREVRQAGIIISAAQLYEQLETLQEIVLLYPSSRRNPKAVTKLTQMTPLQEQLYVTLKLEHYTTR